ncbi:FTR1 family protein [uncultured Peptoniphilus sp.]|uniref:FTR1 family iron permease n=1 Tax=uncultured Peptoniphilus sp. TaxID=254354 RepID=UPI002806455A|nr:FTR1 family protein [uncultured Peptoniphilus sp.]
MKLLKNKINLFILVLLMFATSFITAFADDVQYANWVEVADAMSVYLNEAIEKYKPNDDEAKKAATDAVNVAYFKFYEKIGFEKTTMSAISGSRGSMVEHQFYRAKKMIKDNADSTEVKNEIEQLITYLHEDANTLDGNTSGSVEERQGGGDLASTSTSGLLAELTKRFGTFFAVLGLTLREGLEAILVVAAIAAYLTKTNNRTYLKGVYLGALVGILFSVVLAYVFNVIANKVGEVESGVGQEIFEGIAMFLAVIVLFYVSNWMLSKSEVEVWNRYIQNKVEESISRGNMITLSFTSFLAVAREGAELILFFQGMRSSIAENPIHMWIGLGVAVVILAIVYYLIAKVTVRLPLKPFFTFTSWLMFILCISFVGKGVGELQEADVIGRTIVPWMNGWSFEALGIYDRYENLIPQIILLVVTIISVICQSRRNKKIRSELEARQKN